MTIAHAYLPNLRVLFPLPPQPSLYDRTASHPPGGDLGRLDAESGVLDSRRRSSVGQAVGGGSSSEGIVDFLGLGWLRPYPEDMEVYLKLGLSDMGLDSGITRWLRNKCIRDWERMCRHRAVTAQSRH